MNAFLDFTVLDALVAKLIALITLLAPLIAWFRSIWNKKKRINLPEIEELLKEASISDDTRSSLVSQWRSKDRLISGLLCTLIIVSMLAVWISWSIYSRTPNKADVSLWLTKFDPIVFWGGRTDTYDFARAFADQSDVITDTDITSDINGAVKEFSILARHAKSILEQHQSALLAAVQRGVLVRVLVMDDSAMEPTLAMHARETRRQPGQVQSRIAEATALAEKMAQTIRADKGKYPGSLDLRKRDGLLLYSMWLRDPIEESALVNVGLYSHRGYPHNAAFRVSRKTSPKLVEASRVEFEKLWAESSSAVVSD